MSQADRIREIEDKVAVLSNRNPAYAELCAWVGRLLSETVPEAQDRPSRPQDLPSQAAPEALAQGRSLLNPGDLEMDWKRAHRLLQRLAGLIQGQDERGAQGQDLERLLTLTENDPALFKKVLASDYQALAQAAEDLDIEAGLLNLMLRLALRPTLLALARSAAKGVELEAWPYGHCPVCGSAPGLAHLSGEGGWRTLHCSLCETAWPYPRLQCPFCENRDPQELTILRAKGEEGLGVELCDRCGHYLKTIDLREMTGPIIVPLDDVGTWHLDLIAQRHISRPGVD